MTIEHVEIKKCMTCSKGHMTLSHMNILNEKSHITVNCIFNTEYGFVLMLRSRPRILKSLKALGLSKDFRCFVYKMVIKHQISMIEFDRDAAPVSGEKIFEW